MTTFGDLLTTAFAEHVSQGQVFWIANTTWRLQLYRGVTTHSHPGLVCCARPTLAPGTSKRRRGRTGYGNAFTLEHPEVLNDRPSTFFLAFRKYIPKDQFGRLIGLIHEDDLHRLNRAIGLELEDRQSAD